MNLALFTIESTAMPTPKKFSVSILDVSKAERNANATMLIERIATKRKISVSYDFLTGSQLKTLLTALNPVFFNVTYFDPYTNSMQTKKFYCGDRNTDMIDFSGTSARYSVSFDLIEK